MPQACSKSFHLRLVCPCFHSKYNTHSLNQVSAVHRFRTRLKSPLQITIMYANRVFLSFNPVCLFTSSSVIVAGFTLRGYFFSLIVPYLSHRSLNLHQPTCAYSERQSVEDQISFLLHPPVLASFQKILLSLDSCLHVWSHSLCCTQRSGAVPVDFLPLGSLPVSTVPHAGLLRLGPSVSIANRVDNQTQL